MAVGRWSGLWNLGNKASASWLLSLIIEWVTGRKDLSPRYLMGDLSGRNADQKWS